MNQLSEISLIDFFNIFYKWRKHIIGLVFIITAAAIVFVLLKPKQYLATAVCFPNNSLLADKSFIFNDNIQQLNSYYGSGQDLDRLMSTADLDTIYRYVTTAFDLKKRYKIADTGRLGQYKTIKEFKGNYNLEKTTLGEMKVHVWDKDPVVSAKICNALLKQIALHQTKQNNEVNEEILAQLNKKLAVTKIAFIQIDDSLGMSNTSNAQRQLFIIKKESLAKNLMQYEKLASEFSVAVQTSPSAIKIQEWAKPQAKADKPKKVGTVLGAFFFSCFFSIILVLILEFKKDS